MLNRRKFLYIVFLGYLIVIFIPVNFILYFPSILPFSLPVKEKDTVATIVTDAPLAKESSMSEDITTDNVSNTSAFGNLLDKDVSNASATIVKSSYATFKGCTNESCDSFKVYNTTFFKEEILKVESHTSFLCVNSRINGTDMTKYNINFDIEDDLFSSIDYSKITTVLMSYKKDTPLQYESVGSNINWVSLYLEDCNDIR